MRIISGKYKGNLVPFEADHIRPTTDRVKVTLFNIIQGLVEDSIVLDLFSGTGSLGLEALSRGSASVTFVESNKKSIHVMEKNISKLKIKDGYKIINSDVFSFLKKYNDKPFDLIFADPPFVESLADEVLETISDSKVFGVNTILMIESYRKEKLVDQYKDLFRFDVREFGDKRLSFFRKQENEKET